MIKLAFLPDKRKLVAFRNSIVGSQLSFRTRLWEVDYLKLRNRVSFNHHHRLVSHKSTNLVVIFLCWPVVKWPKRRDGGGNVPVFHSQLGKRLEGSRSPLIEWRCGNAAIFHSRLDVEQQKAHEIHWWRWRCKNTVIFYSRPDVKRLEGSKSFNEPNTR